MSIRNDSKLAFDTFAKTIAFYPKAKLIFHLDRGLQYTFNMKLDE